MGLFDAIGDFMSTTATNTQNEQLTREQWAREDNAVQRHTADMKAAGLNPILAAGGQAQSSAPIPMKSVNFNDTVGSSARAYAQIQEARLSRKQAEANLAATQMQQVLTLAQAKESAQRERTGQWDATLKAAQTGAANHDLNYYIANGLPTNAGASPAAKFAGVRSLIKDWTNEKDISPTVKGAINDILGGN